MKFPRQSQLVIRIVLFIAMPLLASRELATAHAQQAPSPLLAHATVAIFADNSSHVASWDGIFAAIRKNLPEAVASAPSIDAGAQLIRGDAIVPGLNVSAAIVVFLHGDCTLFPRAARFPQHKALGWVLEQKHEIQPYIHVDCTRIVQALSIQSESMNADQRTAAMSEAIARVILHEWIHIASQRSAHHENGLGKAQFTVEDLIPSTATRTVAGNQVPRIP